jgi:hypothetical protein
MILCLDYRIQTWQIEPAGAAMYKSLYHGKQTFVLVKPTQENLRIFLKVSQISARMPRPDIENVYPVEKEAEDLVAKPCRSRFDGSFPRFLNYCQCRCVFPD